MVTQTSKKWQTVKLSEIADVRDGTHATPKKLAVGRPLITSKQLKEGTILATDYCISEADFNEVNKRSKVDINDVLITMIGTVGDTVFIKEEPHFAIKNIGLIKNKDSILGKFIFYWLNSPAGKHEINKRIRGTSQGFISLGSLRDLNISIPERTNQENIIDVLSAYDDLIENNNRRIKILEDIAQKIYTEWFVDFRFPGYEKVKFGKDGLPEEWEIKKVEDIIKRIPAGKKYENKTVEPTGAVPVLDQGKTGVIGYHNDEPGVIASVSNPIIVFANHTCYQNLIMFPFSAIQNVLPFVPVDERNIYWLHFATKDLISFNDYKGHWPEFMTKKLVVPSVEMTKRYGSQIQENIISKYKMEKMNESLKKYRDLLIPQLVTGKLEIKS